MRYKGAQIVQKCLILHGAKMSLFAIKTPFLRLIGAIIGYNLKMCILLENCDLPYF